ncbi:hypothetical protein LUU34_00327800 [Aix galericulata]|nr:hypothetical protein LUU34_00327800 [Aix galericulata]
MRASSGVVHASERLGVPPSSPRGRGRARRGGRGRHGGARPLPAAEGRRRQGPALPGGAARPRPAPAPTRTRTRTRTRRGPWQVRAGPGLTSPSPPTRVGGGSVGAWLGRRASGRAWWSLWCPARGEGGSAAAAEAGSPPAGLGEPGCGGAAGVPVISHSRISAFGAAVR